MNISATLNAFRLIQNPTLCLPHASIPNFNHLPIPLSAAFVSRRGERADIRAVVLDKDNCFAKSKENVVHKPYEVGKSTFSRQKNNSLQQYRYVICNFLMASCVLLMFRSGYEQFAGSQEAFITCRKTGSSNPYSRNILRRSEQRTLDLVF
jgi:hypothetical protein